MTRRSYLLGVSTCLACGMLLAAGCDKTAESYLDSGDNGNITLTSANTTIPQAPVSGTIAGRNFQPNRTQFNGQLEFSQGEEYFSDLSVMLFLFLNGESPAGKEFIVNGDEKFSNPHIHVRYTKGEDETPETAVFTDGYTLNLHFGEINEFGMLPGAISLEIAEEPGANIAGTFVVDAPADRKQPPPHWQQPWVISKAQVSGDNEHQLTAGYLGFTDAGEVHSNLAGTSIAPGDEFFASCTTYSPRNSAIGWNEHFGVHGRHERLTPGKYVFYMIEDETFLSWQFVDVRADAELELNFPMNLGEAGSLTVQVPYEENAYQSVRVAPWSADLNNAFGAAALDNPNFEYMLTGMIDSVTAENGQARFAKLAPGTYRVFFDSETRDVVIQPGTAATVTFAGE